MPNVSLIYNKPPTGEPIPGETLKRVEDPDFNPETVDLAGGILIKVKALDASPYMRGTSLSSPRRFLPPLPTSLPFFSVDKWGRSRSTLLERERRLGG
jgi:hypothetical protein